MHHSIFNPHMSAITLTLLMTVCGWSLVASDSSDTVTADIPPEGAPVFWSLPPAHLQNYRAGPDQETLNYLLPRLSAKFRPNDDWMGVNNDPRFYVLSELGRQENNYNQDNADLISAPGNENEHMIKRDNNKSRRNGPTLSIVQPLDVLRQRMLIEIARRKHLQQMQQVKANREFLENIGKRSGFVPNRQIQSRNALQYDTL